MQPQNSNTNGHPNSLSRQDVSNTEARCVLPRPVGAENMSPNPTSASGHARSNTGPTPGNANSRRDSAPSPPELGRRTLENDNEMIHAKQQHQQQQQQQPGPSGQRPPRQYYSPTFAQFLSESQIQQKRPLVIPSSVLAAAASAGNIPRQRLAESSSRNESPRILDMENQPNSGYGAQSLAQQHQAGSSRSRASIPSESAQHHYSQPQQSLDSPKPSFAANTIYNVQNHPPHPNSASQSKFPLPNQPQQRRPSGDQQRYHQVTAPQQQQRQQIPPPQQQRQQIPLPQQQVQQQLPRRRQSEHTVDPASSAAAPGSTAPPQPIELHASVAKLAANALTPVQTLFEQAWGQTVLNVQHEMSAMHTGLTMLVTTEREMSARLRQERNAAREEVIALRNQNSRLKEELKKVWGMVVGLREEGEKLKKEVEERRLEGERVSVENEVMRKLQHESGRLAGELMKSEQGQGAEAFSTGEYMDEILDIVRAEFGRHMEVRLAAILKDSHEQKSLRIQAEKKLADAMKQLKSITDTAFATSSFSDNSATAHPDIDIETDRDSGSERTTVIGTPAYSTKNLKREYEHIHVHDLEHEQMDFTSSTDEDQPGGRRASTSSPRQGPPAFTPTPHMQPPSTRERFDTPLARKLSSPSLAASSPAPHSPSRALRSLSPARFTDSPDQTTSPQLSTTSTCTQVDIQSGDKVVDMRSSSPVTAHVPMRSVLRRPTSRSPSPPCLPPSNPVPLPRRPPVSPRTWSPRSRDSMGSHDSSQDDQDRRRPRKRSRTEFEDDAGGTGESTRGGARMRVESCTGSEPSMTEMKLEREEAAMDLDHPSPAKDLCPYLNSEGEPDECAAGESGKREEKNELLEEGEVEREEGELDDHGSSYTTTTAPADKSVMAPVAPPDERQPPRSKIGIKHIDLLYETKQERMVCRMCVTRPGNVGSKVWFPLGASWADLVGHCEKEHPAACEEFEKLSPCQVVELRQRMMGNNKVPRRV